jgi:enoyl-CoA hydratase
MSEYNSIIYEKADNIATVTLSRPDQLNALSPALFKELEAALDQADADNEVRVILITGKGNYFCAGLDPKESTESPTASPFEPSWTDQGTGILSKLENLEKPVIAAINGPALGVGFELCLACDLRVASETAAFGFPEIELATMPGAGGTQRLPRLAGIAKAKEMLYFGKTINGQEAYNFDLINMVTPPERLTDAAREMAKELAIKSPVALKMVKQAINLGMDAHLSTGLELERRLSKLLTCTDDAEEALRASAEKRKPSFTGT